MRVLSALTISSLVAFVIVAASASLAADPDTRSPRSMCRWDGTAPFCDGECESGEKFVGAYATKHEARNDQPVVSGVPSNQSWQSFGKDCETGKKARCCFEFCPNGYTMINGTCKNVSTKTRGLELPVPEGPAAEYKKGPFEKTQPYDEELRTEGTEATAPAPAEELKKGPVVAEPEAPYVTKRKSSPFTQD